MDESRDPHWLVTYDVYRRVLASKHLAIGTDFHAAMRKAIDECKAGGWTVENDGAYGFFFCNRGGERREVRMQPTDPSVPVPLNNTAAQGNQPLRYSRRMSNWLPEYIQDIEKAGNGGAWYAALALALALPDICGAIEYPIPGFGARYREWCTAYVVPQITNIEGIDLWLLRCAFLHDGNAEIQAQRDARKSNLGEIYLTASTHVSPHGVRKITMTPGEKRRYSLPVGDLCYAICRGAETWLQDIASDESKQRELNRLLEIFPPTFSPP